MPTLWQGAHGPSLTAPLESHGSVGEFPKLRGAGQTDVPLSLRHRGREDHWFGAHVGLSTSKGGFSSSTFLREKQPPLPNRSSSHGPRLAAGWKPLGFNLISRRSVFWTWVWKEVWTRWREMGLDGNLLVRRRCRQGPKAGDRP